MSRYLHMQLGPPPSTPFSHCAICGAWQAISQRLPSPTALHMLPVVPTIECVTAPVELVTLDELFDSIVVVVVTGLSVSSLML